MNYIIQNENVTVTIASRGAEIISVVTNGKERSWQNPTGDWAGHAPLLFPVCGHCAISLDGKQYPIPFHGFARKTEFSLVEKGDEYIVMSICANEQTKAYYPFNFYFEIKYALKGARVTVTQTVKNLSNTDALYFAIGGHDSFALDYNLDKYLLQFEKEEDIVSVEANDDGYLSGETTVFCKAKTFDLPREYFQNSVTLIMKKVNSRKVTLKEKNGRGIVTIGFDAEFENLLFWREADAQFICIEPWSNLPDFSNRPDVDFRQKAGVIEVAPAQSKTLVRWIEYL